MRGRAQGVRILKMLERFWFGCGHCHGPESCPLIEQMEHIAPPPPRSVARLPIPVTAGLVFLLPLLSAMVAAQCFAQRFAGAGGLAASGWQALGGVCGLIGGVVLAKGLLRLLLGLKLRKSASATDGETPSIFEAHR